MSQPQGFAERWAQFRPSKTMMFWSCAGCIAATLVLGFTAGGWVTGGTADEMVASAKEDARSELAAMICVDNFAAAPGAQASLASLKEASSWERDDFIEDGGWAVLPGDLEVVDGSMDLCAEKLVAMDTLPASTGVSAGEATTAATDEVVTTDS